LSSQLGLLSCTIADLQSQRRPYADRPRRTDRDLPPSPTFAVEIPPLEVAIDDQ